MRYLLLIVFSLSIFSSCQQGEDTVLDNYPKTNGGLVYQLHNPKSGDKPQIGDILELHIQYGIPDSPFFSTFKEPNSKPIRLQLSNPSFPGGIEEGLALMSIGDSATFWIPIDSVFTHMIDGPVPSYLRNRTIIRFDVKLVNFSNESREIQMYLQGLKLNPIALQSGLWFEKTENGNGKKAQPGKRVKVHYEGFLLDGTLFNSSIGNEPLEFLLGRNQVILGWDEAISQMQVGDKATVGVPSYLAYGSKGIPPRIPPFSSLIFNLELIEVID